MNVYDFARYYLQPYKTKGDEIVPQLCPFCKGGNARDKETFALNTSNKTYNCKRGTCGAQGHFTQLCKEFNVEPDKENSFEIYKPKKTYKKPETELKIVTSEAEKYLALRQISKDTMQRLRVGCDDKGNIVFPYYENGDMVFVKFRPARKVEKGQRKAWREEGGKPILWNMDNCTPDKPLIITEGEIDTISVYECGLDNAVSIPSGCEDFTWLETCWEWVDKFSRIILCGDMDEPGKEMVRKLTQKLGNMRVAVVTLSRKDANEVLFYDGKEALKQQILCAKDVPVAGLIDLADVEQIDIVNLPSVPIGIKAIDEATGGSILGDISVWTGTRSSGKSTILGTVMLEAIEKGYKVCAYSGELPAERFQYWINLQAAGKRNIESYWCNKRNKDIYIVNKDTFAKIREWYRGKFFLYDNKVSGTSQETSILQVFEYAVKRYDCKVFLVDNLMTAKYQSANDGDYYLRQVNFIRELVDFANRFNVHVHLVAHPKKKEGTLDNDDISGRAEITNLAHNVYSIERVKDGEELKSKMDVKISVLKNRWDGSLEIAGLKYCPISRRMYQPSSGPLKSYSWEKQDLPDWVREMEEEKPF